MEIKKPETKAERAQAVLQALLEQAPIPPMFRPMLSAQLPSLSSLSDEKVDEFIRRAKILIQYVETGEMIEDA